MHKATKIILIFLLLSFNLPSPTLSRGATSSCAASACVFLPSVQNTGVVYVVEKDHYAFYGVLDNIWGEVTASRPALNVVIEARVYDKATHELVGSGSASPILTATLPGQANPFYLSTGVQLNDHPNIYDTLTITSWTPMTETEYLPVTVVYTQTTYDGYGGAVFARVRNDTGKTLSHVRGVAFHFENQDVIDYEPLLAPGEAITMSFSLRSISPDGSRVGVSVQGIAEEPPPTASPALPSFSLFPEGALGEFR